MQHTIEHLKAADLGCLEPSILELRLGELIRSYSRECTLDLAESVVRHLEALALHPENASNRDQQSALSGFVSHWRWLAEQHRRGVGQNALAA
ncbi:hypothetical protein [Imhoffiella purpurea]|uniref:Uncharacterized protein n=1 Tax=Imhoffiella purpurea TaxID=1249627 RepID=W9VUQ4_9GAMM|nr:hypothetical protein [Imhoffiella purpurea]EXJ14110.1 hypothetical protein D779_2995 [Imhoffiella purpurea]